jgi:hypothetical protein
MPELCDSQHEVSFEAHPPEQMSFISILTLSGHIVNIELFVDCSFGHHLEILINLK